MKREKEKKEREWKGNVREQKERKNRKEKKWKGKKRKM